jgi:hydroxymethylbilane synthase
MYYCYRVFNGASGSLIRMEMTEFLTSVLSWDEMLPAVSQGAIGIQCRADDTKSLGYLAKLNHPPTKTCVDCERAFLAALDGNCRTPIAGQAWIEGGVLKFKGLLMKEDGSEGHSTTSEGDPKDAIRIGTEAGAKLKAAAPHLIEAFQLSAEEKMLKAPVKARN